jgi:hypothetical protein
MKTGIQKFTASLAILVAAFAIGIGRGEASASIDLGIGRTNIVLASSVTEESSSTSSGVVEDVNLGTDGVAVTYKETGHFLALVPVTFDVEAKALPDGTVEVKYPWYSFLTIDHKNERESLIKFAVGAAIRRAQVGSVKAAGAAESPRWTPAQAELVASAIKSALRDIDTSASSTAQ